MRAKWSMDEEVEWRTMDQRGGSQGVSSREEDSKQNSV